MVAEKADSIDKESACAQLLFGGERTRGEVTEPKRLKSPLGSACRVLGVSDSLRFSPQRSGMFGVFGGVKADVFFLFFLLLISEMPTANVVNILF